MRKNVLFMCPDPVDATSWYRGYGPFGALRKQMDINLIAANKVNWSTLQMVDVLFLQRPYTRAHQQIIEMAIDNGVKVWLDYDDDLFKVPKDNPAYMTYHSDTTQKMIAKMIAMADVVTVSTGYLKMRYSKLNQNIHVVSNALNDHILKWPTLKEWKERSKIFNWRGSKTHQRDILVNSEPMLNVEKESTKKGWKWHWIGDHPWFITEQMHPNATLFTSGMDIVEYHRLIKEIQPLFQIVPLADNIFNHSKSNIAWIEGTWSGAVTICPDWEEWKLDGTLRYHNPMELEKCLNRAINMTKKEHTEMLEASMSELKENFLLSKVNYKRLEILESLCS